MSNIEDLRNKMDQVTLDMIRLLKARSTLAADIGKVKESIGKGVTDELRERALRNKVISLCDEIDLDKPTAVKFLNLLLNESVKIQSINKQTHLGIFLKAKELEQQGRRIIHMEVGEPDFEPPSIVQQGLSSAVNLGYRKYGSSLGIQELREKIATKLGYDITADNIMISPGARFAIFAAISTLLSPGDEIIVIEPAWPAYKDCAFECGVKVQAIHTTLEEEWEPSLDQIQNLTNQHTKMIVLNYPNNPTGKVLSTETQDKIVDIARDNQMYILSDEIYSTYTSVKYKSILNYKYEKSIVTQSFSKSHAMTGFRIGYAVSSADIIKRMAKLAALCLTSVSSPIQYAAIKALDVDVNYTNIIKKRLELLTDMARDMGLEFVTPMGAMYLFARTSMEGTDLARSALDHGLAVAPGEGFGEYKRFVRLSACQNEKILIDGMNILGSVMESSV